MNQQQFDYMSRYRIGSRKPLRGREITIDLFCGGGGASTGIEAAIGRPVDEAINHSPDAIFYHEQNHPCTNHFKSDVFDVHPLAVSKGRPVGLLWLSPDCTHFSKSRGGAPKKKSIRSLATVGLWYAREVRPRVIMLENVAEFQTWGRLDKRTLQPDRRYKGELFHKFDRRLKQRGYAVEWRVLKACDYGAPTTRERLVMIARRDGAPIVWPVKTHGPGTGEPYRTAAECIDFSLPTVSIFATKEEIQAEHIRAQRPLADKTMERIARGVWKFVINNPSPFIISIDQQSSQSAEYSSKEPLRTVTQKNRFALVEAFLATCNHSGEAFRGQGLDDPMKTICASRDAHGLVACHIERMHGMSSGETIEKPLSSQCAEVNHRGLVACHIEKMHGTSRGEDISKPHSAVSAQGLHHALVTSHLLSYHSQQAGESRCYPHTFPLPTVDGSNRFAEVRAFLMKYYGCGTGQNMDEPLDTITSKDRFGLVVVSGSLYRIVDIGLRMLTPAELLKAQFGTYAAEYNIKGLTSSAAVHMIGNSVCPDMARAVVAANYKQKTFKQRQQLDGVAA